MTNQIPQQLHKIFKNGSRTYFYSSIFFPDAVKADVFALYSFVRTADDFVDQTPPQAKQFKKFRRDYETSLDGSSSGSLVIDSFVELQKKREFDPKWVEVFLDAMELDLKQKTYSKMQDTISYMHGSAEVIGLMMSKILDLPADAYSAAKYLGRSMQYVNFIRDIQEDNQLGRVYFPQTELKKYGLTSLEQSMVEKHPEQFTTFMHAQIAQYEEWSRQGQAGYSSIPRRFLIPIKTANDLYHWTATEIAKRPIVVFERKVKPSIGRVLFTLLKNIVWSV